MDNSDIQLLVQYLAEAQSPDNEVRKAAENQLLTLKSTNPENYCIYMFNVLLDQSSEQKVRVLSAILLRSSFLTSQKGDKNLWKILTAESRKHIEKKTLELLSFENDKILLPHLSSFLSEIIGCLYEIEDQIHMDEPHELCKQLIDSGEQIKVLAALNIYIGMFDKLFEQMIEIKKDLITVFTATMNSGDHEIAFMGLKAICRLIFLQERKHSEQFTDLSDCILKVTMDAFNRGDEDILEKCLVELKNVSGAEPKFFIKKFNDICLEFQKIMMCKTFEKKSIQVLPIEFITTIITRLKTMFTKKMKIVEKVIHLFYKVMIDVDEEIDEDWLYPQDGCKVEEEEFSTDAAHVCSKCIDNIIRTLGSAKILPIVKALILDKRNISEEEQDWRVTRGNLLILSLLGEYIDNIYDVEPLVQTAIKNYYHENVKVRYAAFHVIGQMSTDLQPAFQAHFGEHLLNTMVTSLDDKYPRLQAHAAASLTNFLEGATDDIVENYIQVLVEKLIKMIYSSYTMCKENAVTCLATVAEAAEDKFNEYYEYTMKELSPFLLEKSELKYYQFKGQLIESIVIISKSIIILIRI